MKDLFTNFNVEILNEKPKCMEISEYDDKDLMFIKAIAITEGVNANNALFERADIYKAYKSFVGKPLKIRFVNDAPTGHGYDPDTNTFDSLVQNIGTIHSAECKIIQNGEERYVWEENLNDEGEFQVVVYMVVWQKYHPEVAQKLRELHDLGELKFSIEAERECFITPEGYRKCFNITFNGLCVVDNPAFEKARSMVVAEILNKKGEKQQMEFKEMYEKEVEKNASLTQTIEVNKNELASKNEELIEKNAELKEAQAERDKLKTIVEKAEREKIGAERMTKLSKYGEVSKSVEELAEMTKEEFVDTLEEAVENYKPQPDGEFAEKDSKLMGSPHFTDPLKKNVGSNKERLYKIMSGML